MAVYTIITRYGQTFIWIQHIRIWAQDIFKGLKGILSATC